MTYTLRYCPYCEQCIRCHIFAAHLQECVRVAMAIQEYRYGRL